MRYLIAALVVLCASGTQAATVTASANIGGCSENSSSSSTLDVSANCSGAFSSASIGSLSASSNTEAFRSTTQPYTTTGNGGATAGFSDTIFFGISSGTFTIPFDFRGLIAVGGFNSDARVSYNVVAGGQPFGASAFSSTDALGVGTFGGVTSSVTNVSFEFTDGQLGISAFIQAATKCGALALRPPEVTLATCAAKADFSSSLRFLGGTVRDQDGFIAQDAYLGSTSGFNYLVGVEPHSPAPIPLPAGAPLLIGGLGLLAFMKRKRSA